MPERAIPLPERPETAEEIIRRLDLKPHPEGGFYRETWREQRADGGRASGTAIYFLLPGGVENRWHRVDAAEIWHFYAGAPLELSIERADGSVRSACWAQRSSTARSLNSRCRPTHGSARAASARGPSSAAR